MGGGAAGWSEGPWGRGHLPGGTACPALPASCTPSSSAGLAPVPWLPQTLCPVSFLPLKSGAQVCAVCAETSGLPASTRPPPAPLSAAARWLPPSPRGGAREEQGRGHLGRSVLGLPSSREERLNLRWGGRGLVAWAAAPHPPPHRGPSPPSGPANATRTEYQSYYYYFSTCNSTL